LRPSSLPRSAQIIRASSDASLDLRSHRREGGNTGRFESLQKPRRLATRREKKRASRPAAISSIRLMSASPGTNRRSKVGFAMGKHTAAPCRGLDSPGRHQVKEVAHASPCKPPRHECADTLISPSLRAHDLATAAHDLPRGAASEIFRLAQCITWRTGRSDTERAQPSSRIDFRCRIRDAAGRPRPGVQPPTEGDTLEPGQHREPLRRSRRSDHRDRSPDRDVYSDRARPPGQHRTGAVLEEQGLCDAEFTTARAGAPRLLMRTAKHHVARAARD